MLTCAPPLFKLRVKYCERNILTLFAKGAFFNFATMGEDRFGSQKEISVPYWGIIFCTQDDYEKRWTY